MSAGLRLAAAGPLHPTDQQMPGDGQHDVRQPGFLIAESAGPSAAPLLTIPLAGLTSGLFFSIHQRLVLFLVAFFTDLFTIDTIGTGFLAGFLSD